MQKKSMGPGFAVLLMLAACSSPSGTLDSAPNDAGADLAGGDAASGDAAGMRTMLRVDFNDGTFGPLGRLRTQLQPHAGGLPIHRECRGRRSPLRCAGCGWRSASDRNARYV
jgi:hypothetical protein